MSVTKERNLASNKEIMFDEQIVSSIVINGDISKLSPQQKVGYYRQFCERLGLDPLSQPFKLLRLNGKEVMYCDRSGAQQLNKIHKVSHEIRARENISGCYVVTAKASTPDGRCTESIGAVPVENLKGESLCNAMMKAETKAKRRATLDLLGLGILDESETENIPLSEPVPTPIQIKEMATAFDVKYDNIDDIELIIPLAQCLDDLARLYFENKELIESKPEVKEKLSAAKQEIINGQS